MAFPWSPEVSLLRPSIEKGAGVGERRQEGDCCGEVSLLQPPYTFKGLEDSTKL